MLEIGSSRAVAGVGAAVDVPGRPLKRTDGLAGIFVLLMVSLELLFRSNLCYLEVGTDGVLSRVARELLSILGCVSCSG